MPLNITEASVTTNSSYVQTFARLGAGVTMAAILAERELAFLHPVARGVGGPAVRQAATVGGNLFAPSPYGDFAGALLALDATVMFAGGFGQREVPLEEFLRSRDRGATLVASVAFKRPPHRFLPSAITLPHK